MILCLPKCWVEGTICFNNVVGKPSAVLSSRLAKLSRKLLYTALSLALLSYVLCTHGYCLLITSDMQGACRKDKLCSDGVRVSTTNHSVIANLSNFIDLKEHTHARYLFIHTPINASACHKRSLNWCGSSQTGVSGTPCLSTLNLTLWIERVSEITLGGSVQKRHMHGHQTSMVSRARTRQYTSLRIYEDFPVQWRLEIESVRLLVSIPSKSSWSCEPKS